MLTLGTRSRLSFAFEPPIMRLTEDARRSVVFLGHTKDPDDPTTFQANATGFFVSYGAIHYLVTAAHVAFKFDDAPFDIRVNTKSGGAMIIPVDPGTDPLCRWHLHSDPTVDVAIMAFPIALTASGFDHLSMDESMILTDADVERHDIGPGDTCYAVGLFRLLQGTQRSLPIVHRGSVAAMPSDELIPIENWRDKGRTLTHAYLVEATNLRGLSGAPVLIRPTISTAADRFTSEGRGPDMVLTLGEKAYLATPSADVALLGIWSGSWDAKPDEASALDRGSETRVPLGLGVVVPAARLRELLESDSVTAHRDTVVSEFLATHASLDGGEPG